eukprot:1158281-Pelagomonas_calceolata.AAC.2
MPSCPESPRPHMYRSPEAVTAAACSSPACRQAHAQVAVHTCINVQSAAKQGAELHTYTHRRNAQTGA